MDARVKKLMQFYTIDADEAAALIAVGLDSPRKVRVGIDKSKLPKSLKKKVKVRQ